MQELEFIRNGGAVARYHTIRTLHAQRVDSHSFNVAMICAMIALSADPNYGVGLTMQLLMAALTHDLAEHKVGDLPAPSKREFGRTEYDGTTMSFRSAWGAMEAKLLGEVGHDWERYLEPDQLHWLKLADAMEGCLHCIEERAMGNRLIGTVYSNFRSYVAEIHDRDNDPEAAADIVTYIDDMWEQYNGDA